MIFAAVEGDNFGLSV